MLCAVVVSAQFHMISCECAPRSDIRLVPIHQHPTVLSWTARPVVHVSACARRVHIEFICYLQLQSQLRPCAMQDLRCSH